MLTYVPNMNHICPNRSGDRGSRKNRTIINWHLRTMAASGNWCRGHARVSRPTIIGTHH